MKESRLCAHFKTNGERCQAIALTDDCFCYFHSRARQREVIIDRSHAARLRRIHSGKSATEYYRSIHSQELFDESSASLFNALELPVLEDANAIQATASIIVRALALQQIDRRSAKLILSGLRIASGNVNRVRTWPHGSDVNKVALHDPEPLQQLADALEMIREAKKAAAAATESEKGSIRTDYMSGIQDSEAS